ncbi:mitotic spindle density 1 [Haematobia irritans]|uniref:mitotic spindle density 1 n=1 Tax=Haematobia irritans TaxID=7368 RepID=UPI003F4FEC6F
MECSVNKILQELREGRRSMEVQFQHMAEVVDKSNNILLQIEALRIIKPVDNKLPYTYNNDTINYLTKIVDKFVHLISVSDTSADTGATFEDYLETASQRAEYLGSNVRKLLAIWNTVQQMRLMLLHQEIDVDNDEEDKENQIC